MMVRVREGGAGGDARSGGRRVRGGEAGVRERMGGRGCAGAARRPSGEWGWRQSRGPARGRGAARSGVRRVGAKLGAGGMREGRTEGCGRGGASTSGGEEPGARARAGGCAKPPMTENAAECAVCAADLRPSDAAAPHNAWSQNSRTRIRRLSLHIRPCFRPFLIWVRSASGDEVLERAGTPRSWQKTTLVCCSNGPIRPCAPPSVSAFSVLPGQRDVEKSGFRMAPRAMAD